MFKDTILRRIVVIILLSVLLSAVLTTAAFYYSGGRVFSGIKAKELRPRAEYLANITADYLQGLITKETYERSIGRGFKVWDASMYAYDACGDLFAYPASEDSAVNNIRPSAKRAEGGKRILAQHQEPRGRFNRRAGGEPFRQRHRCVISCKAAQ